MPSELILRALTEFTISVEDMDTKVTFCRSNILPASFFLILGIRRFISVLPRAARGLDQQINAISINAIGQAAGKPVAMLLQSPAVWFCIQ
jgi:hypothetical protein